MDARDVLNRGRPFGKLVLDVDCRLDEQLNYLTALQETITQDQSNVSYDTAPHYTAPARAAC